MKYRKNQEPHGPPWTFKLPLSLDTQLVSLADRKEISPGLCAKALVIEALEGNAPLTEVQARIGDLEQELLELREQLRSDWVRAFAALLVAVTHGEKVTPKMAEQWAREQLAKT